MPEPIVPDSYWVTDRLAAGEYPGAKLPKRQRARVEHFEAAGITLFVDLTHRFDHLTPNESYLASARRIHHPVVDNDIPTIAEMRQTIDTIDDALAAGETVYVHCWGGIGRTGLAVGCWLVRQGASPEDAVALVRERRSTTPDYGWQPNSPQTTAQHAFLSEWQVGR